MTRGLRIGLERLLAGLLDEGGFPLLAEDGNTLLEE